MAKLLFDESPLVVQPTLAKAVGLNEAIILQQINYWLNTRGSGKVIAGERWIYNTVTDWQKQFPFWSESTIYRTLENLENATLIKTGTFNKSKMDRTKWYTINFATVGLLDALITQEQEMQSVELENASCQNDEMENGELQKSNSSESRNIPETNPEISPEISASEGGDAETQNIFKLYENLGLFLNPIIADELREAEKEFPYDWLKEAFKRAATANARNWRYIRRILDNWKAKGGIDDPKPQTAAEPNAPVEYEDICDDTKFGGGVFVKLSGKWQPRDTDWALKFRQEFETKEACIARLTEDFIKYRLPQHERNNHATRQSNSVTSKANPKPVAVYGAVG